MSGEPQVVTLANDAGGRTQRLVRAAAVLASRGTARVALKLHALWARSEDAKRASDAYDLIRLVGGHGADAVAAAFNDAPAGLPALVRDTARRFLVEDASRTVRWLRAYGLGDAGNVAVAELSSVGDALCRALGAGR